MKKRIISILVVMLMCFTTLFSGCGLVTIDGEKNMAQTIATVKISEDVPTTRSQIKKSHLVMDYISYGYYYVANGEKTQNEVVDMIVENQVGTEIILQCIMQELNEDDNYVKNTDYSKWEVERYLTINSGVVDGEFVLSELDEAKYNALYAINGIIESYIETEEELFGDTIAEEIRAVPTNATNEEKELTDSEKYEYVNKNDEETKNGVKVGKVGSKERKAYNKFIKFVQTNKLVGDEFIEDFTTSNYYKETLASYVENALLDKYAKAYKNEKRKELTFEKLGEKYNEMYEAQQFGFNGNSANFESALSSATASAPIIYSPYSGYAYVYNLLIGVNDEQSKAIEKLKTEYKTDSNEYKTARREILQSITAKDLRSTWILSGYDYDFANKKFTGDYAFLEDSYAFQGNVTCLKEKDGDKPAEYRIDSVYEFGLDEFIEEINKYIYNKQEVVKPSTANPEVYYEYNSDGQVKPANYDEKINELLFAFSTDGGSLNTYKGYLISPKPDADGQETYMQEFADGARKLMTLGDSSYLAVATDYGYHFMFYSTIIDADVNYETLEEYLDSIKEINWQEEYENMLNNWQDYEDKDSYLYKFVEMLVDVDTFYNQKQLEFINAYRYNTKKVNVYSSTYSDMLSK